MDSSLTFDQLWNKLAIHKEAGNCLLYHPCCGVWTTKAAKVKRASHRQSWKWRQIAASLDKSASDIKQAFHAKMTEEGWRLPAVLNKRCTSLPTPFLVPQARFRPVDSALQPADVRASFVEPDLADSEPLQPSLYPLSTLLLTRCHSACPTACGPCWSTKFLSSRLEPADPARVA